MSPGFNSQFCAQFSLFVGLTCIWGHSVTQKMKAKIDEKLLWEMGSDSVSVNKLPSWRSENEPGVCGELLCVPALCRTELGNFVIRFFG